VLVEAKNKFMNDTKSLLAIQATDTSILYKCPNCVYIKLGLREAEGLE